MEALDFIKIAFDVLTALLSIIGGLKLLARHTKSEADDKFLEKLEAPIRFAASFFKKS